ncbi:MAG: PepSY-associated TM helix domain-containing protein [Pirellulaceae bacterium]
MTISGWIRTDRVMRAVHLYTSMFLVPWMVMYAVSGFLVNHNEWFMGRVQPKWEVMQELDFTPGADFPQDVKEQARAILKHVNLDGAHQVSGDDPHQLMIYRYCATGLYRINWTRQPSHVVVLKQLPTSTYSFINALHFQRGYYPPHVPNLPWLIWGITVDAVTISTLLWILTGIYLWARRPRRRWLGGLCLVAGSVLFAVLAALMSR